MEEAKKVFKKKADQIYITIIMYMTFGLIYVAIRGTVSVGTLRIVYQDPVVYIVFVFMLYAILRLFAYWLKKPRIEIHAGFIAIKHEYKERRISFNDIKTVAIVHWRSRYTKERIKYVVIKLKDKSKRINLKLSNYENEDVLANELLFMQSSIKGM